MSLDPQVEGLLEQFRSAGAASFEQLGVVEARVALGGLSALQGEPPVIAKVHDILVPGPAGRLPARIYHPAPAETLPLIVFFHGGGWALGDVAKSDTPCRALALASHCVVASVEYRLCPETRFPGPVEDCFSATHWLAKHATELGAESRKVIVAGESAGGNLAAAVALMARDRRGPALAYQLLIYPVLAPARNSRFPSYRDNGQDYLLTRSAMEWFWDLYLSSPADSSNPYAAPLLADTVSGLPPAMVLAPEYDPLRDEALAYADRLRAAGIAVDIPDCKGLIHGFFGMLGALDRSRQIMATIGATLHKRFAA